MTTATVDGLLPDLQRRNKQVQHQAPERQAECDGSEKPTVERRVSARRLHNATVLSIIAACQITWLAGLAYGIWVLF